MPYDTYHMHPYTYTPCTWNQCFPFSFHTHYPHAHQPRFYIITMFLFMSNRSHRITGHQQMRISRSRVQLHHWFTSRCDADAGRPDETRLDQIRSHQIRSDRVESSRVASLNRWYLTIHLPVDVAPCDACSPDSLFLPFVSVHDTFIRIHSSSRDDNYPCSIHLRHLAILPPFTISIP